MQLAMNLARRGPTIILHTRSRTTTEQEFFTDQSDEKRESIIRIRITHAIVVKNKAPNLLPWRYAQPKFLRHCPHSQFHSGSAQGCRKGRGRREAWCNQSSDSLGTPRFGGSCGLSSSWPWELALTPFSVHGKGGTTYTARLCFEEIWSAGCFRACDAEIIICRVYE
jgi:hypothetical protein